MKHPTIAIPLMAFSLAAMPVASRGENILANGSITIPAASTNAVTQRIVLDSYKGMQWANVRAIRIHNDSVAGANTTATWTAYCNDLDAGTVLASGTLAAAAQTLSTVGTSITLSGLMSDPGTSSTVTNSWVGTTNAAGVVTIATNTFTLTFPARTITQGSTNTLTMAPARIVDITIQPDTAVATGVEHYWHYLIYAE